MAFEHAVSKVVVSKTASAPPGTGAGPQPLFADNYSVSFTKQDELGSGAFSTVYKCTQKKTGFKYAVKVIDVAKLSEKERLKIDMEVQVCSLLKHPNIVSLVDFVREDKKYFLVFELVSGGELFDEIVARSFYSERDASLCISQILGGLKECHAHNVIHRDIKPENLLLADRSSTAAVKLTDFGLAVTMKDGPEYFGFAGTPGYLSPEVVRKIPYGTAVDVWAVGVVLYVLLAGYPPFWHDDHKQMYEQIKSGDYSFPSPEWDTVTPAAKGLIDRMLDGNAATRITVEQALKHPWIARREEVASSLHRQGTLDALKSFNARRKLKGGIRAAMATARLGRGLSSLQAAAGMASFQAASNTDAFLPTMAPQNSLASISSVDGHSSSMVSQPTLSADPASASDSFLQAGRALARIPSSSSESLGTRTPTHDGDSRADERSATVLAANHRLLAAIDRRDWPTYAALVDANLTCFEPEAHGVLVSGLPFHKFFFDAEATSKARSSMMVVNPRVRFVGSDAAIVTFSRLVQNDSGTGGVTTKRFEETRVWEQRLGPSDEYTWLCVHFHKSG